MADRKKRYRNDKSDHKQDRETKQDDVDESSPVIQMFRTFQKILDEKHDKHERIVKLSRDITIESKRAIFLLHRFKNVNDSEDIIQQTETKLLDLERSKFKDVAMELQGTDPYQFLRAYSPGLQEYIEALSFFVYLKDNTIIPLKDVQARLTFKTDCQTVNKDDSEGSTDETIQTIQVFVPPSEYILGLADLTGEMMRRAINSVGDGDLNRPFEICAVLQEVELAYSKLTHSNREVNRKLTVLRQSLRKVESACYTLKVRGSEIPKHMLVDVISKSNAYASADFLDECVVEDD
ncbi:translin-associated protein X-like [Dreissena polymorpha]|uniref:Translin-associated protein X n=1 Tax=Dreissena polymorpha TaxID=45954 RepID=A0A9D4KY94_DREPO|nr:translin-associated protein X-like [Dreissena polymorpha]KAH3848110.1 hypothetical protein DPMN_090459 [Dreissena polymorpha]